MKLKHLKPPTPLPSHTHTPRRVRGKVDWPRSMRKILAMDTTCQVAYLSRKLSLLFRRLGWLSTQNSINVPWNENDLICQVKPIQNGINRGNPIIPSCWWLWLLDAWTPTRELDNHKTAKGEFSKSAMYSPLKAGTEEKGKWWHSPASPIFFFKNKEVYSSVSLQEGLKRMEGTTIAHRHWACMNEWPCEWVSEYVS